MISELIAYGFGRRSAARDIERDLEIQAAARYAEIDELERDRRGLPPVETTSSRHYHPLRSYDGLAWALLLFLLIGLVLVLGVIAPEPH